MNRLALCLLGFAAIASVAVAQGPAPSILDAWEAKSYHLAGGGVHRVRGRIVFTASEWLVVFFVMDDDVARRGSGEGGSYMLSGDSLTLRHQFLLAAGDAMEGLPASPLRMEARESLGPSEPTRIELREDRLVLYFPSGNSMVFAKTSE